jgi:hypothetical protein
MNLPDPIVTFAEDEPPADTSQLFPDKNYEFNSKVENTVVISSTEPQENEIIPDPSYLKWNVVKTDSEVHVEKLGNYHTTNNFYDIIWARRVNIRKSTNDLFPERRLKLLQEGKIKPKAPPVNKDPFRGMSIDFTGWRFPAAASNVNAQMKK